MKDKKILILMTLFAASIGFILGQSYAINGCVKVGLKLLSLDGVHLDFSDSLKGILKMYRGELG